MNLINKLADFIFVPAFAMGPLPGLFIISLVSAYLFLIAFKYTSNQEKIHLHKNKIFGHFLEIALFRDQFIRVMTSQAKAFWHNLLYLKHFLVPLLILAVPFIFICMQLDFRLGNSPLRNGDAFIIEADLAPETTNAQEIIKNITIHLSPGLTLETPAMVDAQELKIFWRARVIDSSAANFVEIGLNGTIQDVSKQIRHKISGERFTDTKYRHPSWKQWLQAGEEPIPSNAFFDKLRTEYQPASYSLLGWEFSIITWYVVLTIILGLLVKPLVKVNI